MFPSSRKQVSGWHQVSSWQRQWPEDNNEIVQGSGHLFLSLLERAEWGFTKPAVRHWRAHLSGPVKWK